MIIIGIDPGTASTGYGIVECSLSRKDLNKMIPDANPPIKFLDVSCLRPAGYLKCLRYGLIKTLPVFNAGERLRQINNELSKIIKTYRPEILAIESLFFIRNLKTAIPVSQASGVILLTAAKNKIPVEKFTPLQVKLAITGNGWAEKKLVQKKIKVILKLKEIPKPDDAADALAIAVTYILKNGVNLI